jgi:hypothetical protein
MLSSAIIILITPFKSLQQYNTNFLVGNKSLFDIIHPPLRKGAKSKIPLSFKGG